MPGAESQPAAAPHVYSAGAATSDDLSETVSLFTGLNYTMGERSRGISMGAEGELLNVSSDGGQLSALPSIVGPIDRVTTETNVEETTGEPQKKTKKVD